MLRPAGRLAPCSSSPSVVYLEYTPSGDSFAKHNAPPRMLAKTSPRTVCAHPLFCTALGKTGYTGYTGARDAQETAHKCEQKLTTALARNAQETAHKCEQKLTTALARYAQEIAHKCEQKLTTAAYSAHQCLWCASWRKTVFPRPLHPHRYANLRFAPANPVFPVFPVFLVKHAIACAFHRGKTRAQTTPARQQR